MDIVLATNKNIDRCFEIRYKVFVEEQKVPIEIEIDEYDKKDDVNHFLIVQNNQYVGTFRCLYENSETIHLQRLCILKEFRGLDLGQSALSFIEEYYKKKGIKKVILNAQISAIPFYEKSNYNIISDEFEEAGIIHKTMEKLI